jgi:hypothetical protein
MASQVEQLEGFLVRIGRFLELAEDVLSKASFSPAMLMTTPASCPPFEVGVDSMANGGEEIYGYFSPRVGDNSSPLSASPSVTSTIEGEALAAVVAPVLEIMPELQGLCASPVLPSSEEHVNVDSMATLSSPERSDVISTTIPPKPALNSDALFAKELCDILSSLEAANPGIGRALACILTGSTIKSKIKKVRDCPRTGIQKEKSLKRKDKKSGTIRKTSVAT